MSRSKSSRNCPPAALAAYDLIILSNVPAAALPEPRMKALQTYVRDDRGGLIVVGGDHSFTPGGYRHTTLEEILPVISEERTNKPKPTLAMVLVLDISGSMNDPAANGKIRNIDLAKEALRTAVKMLGPRDQVGVLVFEDHSRWIWPLAPVTDKQKIIDRDRHDPGRRQHEHVSAAGAGLSLAPRGLRRPEAHHRHDRRPGRARRFRRPGAEDGRRGHHR